MAHWPFASALRQYVAVVSAEPNGAEVLHGRYHSDTFGYANQGSARPGGASQKAFARTIEMDRSCFASIEIGHRNVNLQNLVKIASGFNIKLSEPLEGISYDASRAGSVDSSSSCLF